VQIFDLVLDLLGPYEERCRQIEWFTTAQGNRLN